jgi:hypothetical protein
VIAVLAAKPTFKKKEKTNNSSHFTIKNRHCFKKTNKKSNYFNKNIFKKNI